MPNFAGKIDVRPSQIKSGFKRFFNFQGVINQAFFKLGNWKSGTSPAGFKLITNSTIVITEKKTSGQLFP